VSELPELVGDSFFIELRAYDQNGKELAKRGLEVKRQTTP
jgi:hypothetical protein